MNSWTYIDLKEFAWLNKVKLLFELSLNFFSESTTLGLVQGQLAFRPAPTDEMRKQGLKILKRKRNNLRVIRSF